MIIFYLWPCNLRDTAQGTRELSINNQVEEKAILIETCHVTKMLTECKLLCQTLSREANPLKLMINLLDTQIWPDSLKVYKEYHTMFTSVGSVSTLWCLDLIYNSLVLCLWDNEMISWPWTSLTYIFSDSKWKTECYSKVKWCLLHCLFYVVY